MELTLTIMIIFSLLAIVDLILFSRGYAKAMKREETDWFNERIRE